MLNATGGRDLKPFRPQRLHTCHLLSEFTRNTKALTGMLRPCLREVHLVRRKCHGAQLKRNLSVLRSRPLARRPSMPSGSSAAPPPPHGQDRVVRCRLPCPNAGVGLPFCRGVCGRKSKPRRRRPHRRTSLILMNRAYHRITMPRVCFQSADPGGPPTPPPIHPLRFTPPPLLLLTRTPTATTTAAATSTTTSTPTTTTTTATTTTTTTSTTSTY